MSLQLTRLCLYLLSLIIAASVGASIGTQIDAAEPTGHTDKPNILWLTSEDNGPELGCYGDAYASTPHLDRLASRGMKYLNCWSNAPVCAPARTTIISGLYPPSTGSQHMRSMTRLPDDFNMYPVHLRRAGYYCTNRSKEDYNLAKPKGLWDDSSGKAHWRNRPAGQPFFSIFNITTSHESQLRKRPHQAIHDPAKVIVPPFHPDLPEVRQDWAQYYDKVSEMDAEMGEILAQLEKDGLAENTIIFYYGDHGTGMPRGKRWLYQTGLRVPLIVYFPPKFAALAGERYQAGSDNDELVGFIDLFPTLLSLLGEKIPSHLQGRALLGPKAETAPKYMFGFRDRMDERYDLTRAVRDERYAYIRNFLPQRPQGQYLDYMFQTPTTQAWKKAFDSGKLTAVQSTFWQQKAPEELYDLQLDPYQINNLAADPAQHETLVRMRGALQDWMLEICDLGLLPEGEIHHRAAGDAPYTMGHNPQRYPIQAIYQAADLATRPQPGDESKVLALLDAEDGGERFWGAVGVLWRGLNGQTLPLDRLVSVMRADPSSYVRSAAAETVARLGSAEQRQQAITQLIQDSDQSERSTYEAMQALNGLAHSEPSATELGGRLTGLSAKSQNSPERVDGYVARLLAYFKENLGKNAK